MLKEGNNAPHTIISATKKQFSSVIIVILIFFIVKSI